MNENVLIHTRAVHIHDREQPEDIIDVSVPGKYHFHNGRHYLLYEEHPEENGAPVASYLNAGEDDLLIVKKGPVRTRMSFRKGMASFFVYETSHGSFQMVLRTHSYTLQKEEGLLRIDLRYSLEIDDRPFSFCLMRIVVRNCR